MLAKKHGVAKGPSKKATLLENDERHPITDCAKTHLLVVQGGTNSAFLGDFLALVEFFQKKTSPAFSGDFWTVYSPQDYFQASSKYDTIKFDGRVIFTAESLTKDEDQHFEKIDKPTICAKVFQWLSWKADAANEKAAKPGDSIILIFLALGVWSKKVHEQPTGMRIGTNDLLVTTFVNALRAFSKDIQINVLSTACYGAIFAEKIEADNQPNRWVQVASEPLKEAYAAERSASGQYQNSRFIAGFVKSLGSLKVADNVGLLDGATIESLNNDLRVAVESHPKPERRSTPTLYTDLPLSTKINCLLLRRFADFPLTPKNTAARRRQELNINALNRPIPDSAQLVEKTSFAVDLIADEHKSFGEQDTSMLEERFEEVTRDSSLRERYAGDILRGMFIRGRLQAAVWDVFLQLCLQGACSLRSLALPVDWNNSPQPGTCFGVVLSMLSVFRGFNADWESIQEHWGIAEDIRWFAYNTPLVWLSTMIGRGFTSVNTIFDIIRATGQLGEVDTEELEKVKQNFSDKHQWIAEPKMNVARNYYGSGTFAFWLPEGVCVDATLHESVDLVLSGRFYSSLERLEDVYRRFFDVSREEFDQDVLDVEQDVRDWVAEDMDEELK